MALPEALSKEVLGYQLHTNREFGMMMRGEKPLAVFSEIEGEFAEPLRRYIGMFDRQAKLGHLVRSDHAEARDGGGTSPTFNLSIVMFALPTEAWRFDAMIDLRRHLHEWSAEHERREGSLLGYTDRENDIWMARWRRQIGPSYARSNERREPHRKQIAQL